MTAPISSDIRPALWNPNAAACWSLIFTPAFGSYLHARNADALGRIDEAKANRVWFRVSLGYLVVVCVSIFIPTIPEAVFRGAAIGLLFGWYLAVAKKQVEHVKQTFHGHYHRKSWAKPLAVGLGCFVAFLVVIFGLIFVVDSQNLVE
jgi:hypothetical protein